MDCAISVLSVHIKSTTRKDNKFVMRGIHSNTIPYKSAAFKLAKVCVILNDFNKCFCLKTKQKH